MITDNGVRCEQVSNQYVCMVWVCGVCCVHVVAKVQKMTENHQGLREATCLCGGEGENEQLQVELKPHPFQVCQLGLTACSTLQEE